MSEAVTVIVNFCRASGYTPALLRAAALELEEEGLTLNEVLERIGLQQLDRIENNYKAGLHRVLTGDQDVEGFGREPLSAFTLAEARARAGRLQERLGARLVETRAAKGHVPAGGDRHAGAGAVEAYVRALKAVGKVLVEHDYRSHNPMEYLSAPPRAQSARDLALTDSEVCDYLRAVILGSTDPLLDAVLWLTFRLTAARFREVLALRAVDLHPARRSVTLDGKGKKRREMPLPEPVYALLGDLDRRRPGSCGAARALLRDLDGRAAGKRRIEGWSKRLHREYQWARGSNLRVHTLRHTTARQVEAAVGLNSLDTVLFMGHDRSRLGVTGTYVWSDAGDPLPRRERTFEAAFGPRSRWPELPENDVLASVPELKEWMK